MLGVQNCFNKPSPSSLLSAAAFGVIITSIAILALTASISPTSTLASAFFTGTGLGLTAAAIASLIRHVKREKAAPEQITKLSWEEVKKKEVSFINAHLQHFTSEQIGWLEDDQLPGLNVAALSDKQLSALLPTGDFFAELTSKRRLNRFSVEQVHILAPRLSDAQLVLFDDELLKKMDLNLFSAAQIKVLFTDKSRFAWVIIEDVQGELHLKLAQAGYQKNS